MHWSFPSFNQFRLLYLFENLGTDFEKIFFCFKLHVKIQKEVPCTPAGSVRRIKETNCVLILNFTLLVLPPDL